MGDALDMAAQAHTVKGLAGRDSRVYDPGTNGQTRQNHQDWDKRQSGADHEPN
jgi:hypothetical protein